MSATRILELAETVKAQTAAVDSYLRENGLPSPSFDEDGPVDFNIKSHEVERARMAALSAALELSDLLVGPALITRPVLNGSALQAIYRWDIPSKVPIGGEISFEHLAKQCNVQMIDVRRLLRFAMVHHRVFQEKRPGYVSHSAASRNLAEEPQAMMGLGLMFDEVTQAFAKTVDALDTHKENNPNETGWSLANNSAMAIYQYHKQHPHLGKRFAGAMARFSKGTGQSLEYLVNGYDWASVGNGSGTVVDVGGGNGLAAFALAAAVPALRCTVQDLPPNVEAFKDSVPEPLKDRVEFAAHDFFNPQPVCADAYLFRQIFHNNNDMRCVKILQATIPALRPGAKLIANDRVVPPPGTMGLIEEREVRDIDLIMLSLMNATEREQSDWKRIFAQADPRFTDIKFSKPEGSLFSIIETTWSG